MSIPTNTAPDFAVSPPAATVPPAATRPLYWSVRRELWENKSVYIAPLIAAGIFLFGYMISLFTLQRRMRRAMALEPMAQHEMIAMPYNIVIGIVLVTAFIVGVFYCLDALHGERRDRSILFWKSLPVSDRITVLSKAIIPLAVMPLLVFVISGIAQLIILFLGTVALLGHTRSVEALWSHVPLFSMWIAQLYALITIALWHAPLYGWLLLVSVWARRTPFLWATLPLLGTCALERIALGSSHLFSLLKYRVVGWFPQAFDVEGTSIDPLTAVSLGKFLATPGLWIGLLYAAGFFVVAVRLRRYREPI